MNTPTLQRDNATYGLLLLDTRKQTCSLSQEYLQICLTVLFMRRFMVHVCTMYLSQS